MGIMDGGVVFRRAGNGLFSGKQEYFRCGVQFCDRILSMRRQRDAGGDGGQIEGFARVLGKKRGACPVWKQN